MSLKLFRALPRPLLKYAGIPLLFYAVLNEGVTEGKLKILAFFLAAAYGFRGVEKIAAMIAPLWLTRSGIDEINEEQ